MVLLALITAASIATSPPPTPRAEPSQWVVEADPHEPVSARMSDNMTIKLAGIMGMKITARDLPIIGKRSIDGRAFWVVELGAKAYQLLVDAAGNVYSAASSDGNLIADKRVKPADLRITPIPR